MIKNYFNRVALKSFVLTFYDHVDMRPIDSTVDH